MGILSPRALKFTCSAIWEMDALTLGRTWFRLLSRSARVVRVATSLSIRPRLYFSPRSKASFRETWRTVPVGAPVGTLPRYGFSEPRALETEDAGEVSCPSVEELC